MFGDLGGFLFQPYFLSLKNLIMSRKRAITPVIIKTKVKIPSYVTIVITSLSGAIRLPYKRTHKQSITLNAGYVNKNYRMKKKFL